MPTIGKSGIFFTFFFIMCVSLFFLAYYYRDVDIVGNIWKQAGLLSNASFLIKWNSLNSAQVNHSAQVAVKGNGSDSVHSNPPVLTSIKGNSTHGVQVKASVLTAITGNGTSSVQVKPPKPDCDRKVWGRINRTLTQQETGFPNDLSFMYEKQCPDYQQPADTKKKLILVFNRQEWWFPNDPPYKNVFKGCPYDACRFTDDKRLLSEADAVLVFVCRLGTRTPPPRPSSSQIWIAFCLESPVHYSGHHDSPAWRSVFNWTMGYRVDSDVFYPYAVLAARSGTSRKNYTSIALQKTRSVAWFVSNCHTPSKREQYVKELQNHIDVDIYGGCSKNKCPRSGENNCLELLRKKYYFYASFENSLCQDYVTEKFFKTFTTDVVPIVRGGASYSRYFPPGTHLNTASYSSPKQLAEHLKTLIANPKAYARLLEAKDRFGPVPMQKQDTHICELCRHLHTSSSVPKVYPDFMKWTRGSACKPPSDI